MVKPVLHTAHFKEDLKKIIRSRRYRFEDLLEVLALLQAGHPLEARYKNHPLFGKWRAYKECHIKPDWLLIYANNPDTIHLIRTGSHSDLFI